MLAQMVRTAAVFLVTFTVASDLNAYTLFEKLEEAKSIAEGIELSYSIKKAKSEKTVLVSHGEGKEPIRKKTVTYYDVLHRTVALVGIHKESGDLKTVTFKESFALEMKRRPKEKAPMIIGRDGGCEIWWNGGNRYGLIINLSFQCDGKEYVPLRIKRWSVYSGRAIIRKKGVFTCVPKRTEELVAYTPHSPLIHQPDFIDRGKKYVEETIQRAFDDLAEQRIASRAAPAGRASPDDIGRAAPPELIGENASMDLPLWFARNEHMDHERFFASRREGSIGNLMDEFFAELGANLEETKKWSISSGDAYGIAQFICPTFARVLNEYPKAGLPHNFLEGMRDHVQAFKAMILLWDSDAVKWTARAKKICNATPDAREECLAASYISGPGRLNSVIVKRGEGWMSKDPIMRNKRHYYAPKFPDHTYIYLEKLRAIREYFLKEK